MLTGDKHVYKLQGKRTHFHVKQLYEVFCLSSEKSKSNQIRTELYLRTNSQATHRWRKRT